MKINQIGDVKGNTGSNIIIGDVDGDVNQNIKADDKIEKLFEEWIEQIQLLLNVDNIDAIKEDIADIKDSLHSKKTNIAKKLFYALPGAIRTVAAGLSIASHWFPSPV